MPAWPYLTARPVEALKVQHTSIQAVVGQAGDRSAGRRAVDGRSGDRAADTLLGEAAVGVVHIAGQ